MRPAARLVARRCLSTATHEEILGFSEFSSFVAYPAHLYRVSVPRQTELPMKLFSLSLVAALTLSAASAVAAAAQRTVSLTQDPVVMRLNKDEFRIAFGINGERCGSAGCSGMIRYRVNWRTADGIAHSETKQVSYLVSPLASRTIAVDRQYFDTAEGQHTTEVVKVTIEGITCRDAVDRRTATNL
jgi:hypothetical protein